MVFYGDLEQGSDREGEAKTGAEAEAEAMAEAETGHRGRSRARGRKGRGLMGLKKGRETLTEKRGCSAAVCGALRLRCCGNGGNLLEWGGARESTVPFIIRYCRPEAVNDNDARARRGESAGMAGRDWQVQKNARSLSLSQQLLLVWIQVRPLSDLLTLHLCTSDRWLALGGPWEGAYLEQQEGTDGEFRTRIFEQERTAATLPRQFRPKRNMGLKILVLSGSVGDWRRDWDLLGSAWMEEAHLTPKGERRTKQDGRGRNEREK